MIQFINQLQPDCLAALNEALTQVVAACRTTNAEGALTLKLKIKPALDRNMLTIVTMTPAVSIDAPRHKPTPKQAYVIMDEMDNAVDLSADHPAQLQIFQGEQK